MSASNRYSGEITITPPLTAAEIRQVTGSYDWSDSFDAHLRINEATEQTADGEIIRRTADAIVGPDGTCSGYDVQEQIQTVVDLFPDRTYAGFIELDPDPGYGESTPSRYVVRDRRVVEVQPMLTWPGEENPELTEARDLANLALGILRDMPTCLDEFDASLDEERLPQWAGGDAETWQREDAD